MSRTIPRHRRLRLADPSPEALPEVRASIAYNLIQRYAPLEPAISDGMLALLGCDSTVSSELEHDPRFIVGRLAQALSMMLADDASIPPMDRTASLLGDAIEDAMHYRQRTCPKCDPEGVCAACWPNWQQAAKYELLWTELGVIDEMPRPRPVAVAP